MNNINIFKKISRTSIKRNEVLNFDPEDPILDTEINNLSKEIEKLLNKGYLLKEIPLQTTKEKMFQYFHYIFSKKTRNPNEILIVKQYLSTFQKYSEVNESKEKDQMLTKISKCLRYEYKPNGYIICCLGEPGDKFYILFKGIVTILIPNEYNFEITEKDYLKHLKRLYQMEEYEILQRTVYSNTNIKLKQDFYDLILRLNEHIKDHKVSINDYLDRIMPITTDEDDELNDNKIKVKLWNYKKVCDIYAGGTFGEVALMDEYSKRSASIITIEPCIFGTISKEDYQEFIKETENKLRRNNIINLLTHNLFKNVREEIFEKHKFFNLFRYIEFNQGEYIIKQGNKRDEIYFIKEGEVCIEMYGSIKDINNILNEFGNKENDRKYDKFIKNNPKFKKLYFNKRYYRLFNVDKRHTIGLNEYSYKGKYFSSAKVISQKCTIFALEITFLDVLTKDRIIQENLKNLIPERIKFIVFRLLELKYFYLNKFLEYIKDDDKDKINKYNLSQKNKNTHFKKNAIKTQNTKNNFHSLSVNFFFKKNLSNYNSNKEIESNKENLTIFSTQLKKNFHSPNQVSINSTSTIINDQIPSLKTISHLGNKKSTLSHMKLIKRRKHKISLPGIEFNKIIIYTEENKEKENDKEEKKNDINNLSNSQNIKKYLDVKNTIVNKIINSSYSQPKKNIIKEFKKNNKIISSSNVDLISFDKFIEKIEKKSDIFHHIKKEGWTGKKCHNNKYKIIPIECNSNIKLNNVI